MGRSAEFEAAHINARDIQPGDYLDPSVKLRVHASKMIGSRLVVAHRLRGSKAPGITEYAPEQSVKVWRKKQ